MCANTPGAIALSQQKSVFTLRTTTMTTALMVETETTAEMTDMFEPDDASTHTEATGNANNADEREHREQLIAFEINHLKQRPKQSFAESLQKFIQLTTEECEDKMQIFDKTNKRIENAATDKEWRHNAFTKKFNVNKARASCNKLDIAILKINSKHLLCETKESPEIAELLLHNPGIFMNNHEGGLDVQIQTTSIKMCCSTSVSNKHSGGQMC